MKIKKDREKYISLSLMSAITIAHSLQPEKPLQKFRHTIMIIISGHLIGGILYILFGVAHSNTNARTLQHFQIILIISESDHMHPVNTKLCAKHGKTHTLVPVSYTHLTLPTNSRV